MLRSDTQKLFDFINGFLLTEIINILARYLCENHNENRHCVKFSYFNGKYLMYLFDICLHFKYM